MKEQDYKTYIYDKADKVKTKEQLDELLKEIVESKELCYGTIVFAISGAMLATAHYINESEVGGITGFQAGFIGWEMIRKFLVHENKTALKIINYDDLLYPQYKNKFKKVIDYELWKTIQDEAKILLSTHKDAHPKVIKHWGKIVKGKVPFGYKVEVKMSKGAKQ